MPMKLTADDLREIADTVEAIDRAKLDVEIVKVRGHKVMLEREDSQMDGLHYTVKGITSGEFSGRGKQ